MELSSLKTLIISPREGLLFLHSQINIEFDLCNRDLSKKMQINLSISTYFVNCFFRFSIGITDEFDDDDDILYGKDDDDLHHPFAVTDRAIPNPFASGGVTAEKLNPVKFMKII